MSYFCHFYFFPLLLRINFLIYYKEMLLFGAIYTDTETTLKALVLLHSQILKYWY